MLRIHQINSKKVKQFFKGLFAVVLALVVFVGVLYFITIVIKVLMG